MSFETLLAEREGFEPPDLWQSTVFKTAAFDRSAISPAQKYGFATFTPKKNSFILTTGLKVPTTLHIHHQFIIWFLPCNARRRYKSAHWHTKNDWHLNLSCMLPYALSVAFVCIFNPCFGQSQYDTTLFLRVQYLTLTVAVHENGTNHTNGLDTATALPYNLQKMDQNLLQQPTFNRYQPTTICLSRTLYYCFFTATRAY